MLLTWHFSELLDCLFDCFEYQDMRAMEHMCSLMKRGTYLISNVALCIDLAPGGISTRRTWTENSRAKIHIALLACLPACVLSALLSPLPCCLMLEITPLIMHP